MLGAGSMAAASWIAASLEAFRERAEHGNVSQMLDFFEEVSTSVR